ncbi:hypothetical protein HNY73_013681 [Argiope bruennichi]|uniref:Uncharacterized protein n=1 Tax=Argiope bruennichi TaxID=94029 RepID=A0A8T0EZM5_ARGBR|nr:hypothetical protein HNY73_013681 [Argiope bruennichi]
MELQSSTKWSTNLPLFSRSPPGPCHGAHGQHALERRAPEKHTTPTQGHPLGRAHSAHGHHNAGAASSHDAHGAKGFPYGSTVNVGAYAQATREKGYEKAYDLRQEGGHHAVLADTGAQARGVRSCRDRVAHHQCWSWVSGRTRQTWSPKDRRTGPGVSPRQRLTDDTALAPTGIPTAPAGRFYHQPQPLLPPLKCCSKKFVTELS